MRHSSSYDLNSSCTRLQNAVVIEDKTAGMASGMYKRFDCVDGFLSAHVVLCCSCVESNEVAERLAISF
jgi:hypothetical protein